MTTSLTTRREIGKRFSETREARHLQISEVSQRLYVSDSVVRDIEQGSIEKYYLEIYAMSCLYEKPIHELLGGFFGENNSASYFLRDKTQAESEEIAKYVLDYIEFQRRLHNKKSYLSGISKPKLTNSIRRISVGVLKSRVEGLLQKHRLYKLPINVYQIAKNLGICVTYESLPVELYNLRGFCHSEDGFALIVINRNHPIELQRFTMAHELHHLIYDSCHVPFSCGSYNQNNIVEQNAEHFAAELLMPNHLVQKLFSYLPNINYLTINLVASHFKVSYEAAAIRLQNFGLIDSASDVCKSSYRKKDKEKTQFLLRNKIKYLKAVFGLETGIKEIQVDESVNIHSLCGNPIFDDSHQVCWYCGLEINEPMSNQEFLLQNPYRQKPSNLSPDIVTFQSISKKIDYTQLSLNLKVN
jgi:Zn-dependent peptidase ImmA (M78 family)